MDSSSHFCLKRLSRREAWEGVASDVRRKPLMWGQKSQKKKAIQEKMAVKNAKLWYASLIPLKKKDKTGTWFQVVYFEEVIPRNWWNEKKREGTEKNKQNLHYWTSFDRRAPCKGFFRSFLLKKWGQSSILPSLVKNCHQMIYYFLGLLVTKSTTDWMI